MPKHNHDVPLAANESGLRVVVAGVYECEALERKSN